MQAVVGCKVEGNYYFNCQFICKCLTCTHPDTGCEKFKPLGRYITHQHIADWIGISRQHLNTIINRYGIDKVIELLEIRGHIVRYEVVCEYVKFYEMGEKK